MISDRKREEIRKEAKEILAGFAKSLEKVNIKGKALKKGVEGFGEEQEGLICDADFRKRMFENAPNKSDDFILTERKGW